MAWLSGMGLGSSAQIRLGFKTGVYIGGMTNGEPSSMSLPEEVTHDPAPNPGLVFGTQFELRAGKRLALQPEITFVQKGSQTDFGDYASQQYRNAVRLNYLEMPVLAKFCLVRGSGKTGGAQLFLVGGPVFATLLGGSYHRRNGASPLTGQPHRLAESNQKGKVKEIPGLRKFEKGIAAGVQLLSHSGAGDITFDLRVHIGLDTVGYHGNDKNIGVQIAVGYMF